MKWVLCLLLLLTDPGNSFHKTARANKAKAQAEKQYKENNYKEALKTYSFLTDSLKVVEDEILLNKSHCLYKLKDLKSARETYTKLSNSTNKKINSIANMQLGSLAYQDKQLEKALAFYKASIKSLPENADARYNYELLKKQMKKNENKDDKQQKQDKKDQSKPQEPSESAKKLKERAEALAATYRYDEAHQLMLDGAKKDQSVLYFQDFIDRLKIIADLNKL